MQLRCERQFYLFFWVNGNSMFYFFWVNMNFGRKYIVCGSCLFKNSFALADSAPSCGSGRISGGCRLGCALGSRKRQQICRSSGGSSIGSCGIGCCGGGGSVGAAAAGCTLTVGAAGRGLVGAGGVLRLRPRGSHYALAARASPSRLALRPRGSGFALAARASRSRLALRARGSHYALAARASPSRLGFALAAHATRSRLGLRRRRQWKRRRRMLALAARATRSQARASPSRLGFALAARLRPNTTIKQQSSGRKSCFGSAAAYLPQR
jgi:hypothetical protein